MWQNETYSTVRVDKHMSDMFPIKNGFKQGDALSPLLFNFAAEQDIRGVQVNYDGLKLNGTIQLPVFDDNVNTQVIRKVSTVCAYLSRILETITLRMAVTSSIN